MAPEAVIVIGSGRSGTSLATQALGALGVTLPDDPVPASENNLHGTGESTALRDMFTAMKAALGHCPGFRPAQWEQDAATLEARRVLAEYLEERAAVAGPFGFTAKFPFGSVFLPLWQRAAAEAGVTPRFVWATRGAGDTLGSLIRSYSLSVPEARRPYLQRLYYVLHDAPDDTLVLPYEGWVDDPAAQIAALADLVGQTDPARRTEATAAYASTLDHGGSADRPELLYVETAIDALIRRKCGRLIDLVDRASLDFLRLMTALADEIARLNPRAPHGRSDDEQEMRLALLARLAKTSEQESPEMHEQIEILTRRIREVSAENRELKRDQKSATQRKRPQERPSEKKNKTADLTQKSQRLTNQIEQDRISIEAPEDRIKALETELAEKARGLNSLEKERDALISETADLSERLRQSEAANTSSREAYARLALARDALEQDIERRFRLSLQDLESREARFRLEAEKLRKAMVKMRRERDAFHNSTSWKITAPIRKIMRNFSPAWRQFIRRVLGGLSISFRKRPQ